MRSVVFCAKMSVSTCSCLLLALALGFGRGRAPGRFSIVQQYGGQRVEQYAQVTLRCLQRSRRNKSFIIHLSQQQHACTRNSLLIAVWTCTQDARTFGNPCPQPTHTLQANTIE